MGAEIRARGDTHARHRAMRAAIALVVAAAHLELVYLVALRPAASNQVPAAERVTVVYSVSRPSQPASSAMQTKPAPRIAAATGARGRPGRSHRAMRSEPERSSRARTAPHRAAPIDWAAEARGAAENYLLQLDRDRRAADLIAGRDAVPAALRPLPPAPPVFDWSPPRVEVRDGVGVLIRLNDHCVIVISAMIVGGCALGHVPVRGDLFAHMRAAPDPRAPRLP